MKYKAYKVELLIIDFDGIGEKEIVDVLENTRYPNRCVNPSVMTIEGRDIGDWHDGHPLNQSDQQRDEFHRLFR